MPLDVKKRTTMLLVNTSDTYSLANVRVTGERTGVEGSSHSGSGLITSGAGFPEARCTNMSVTHCLEMHPNAAHTALI